MPLMGHKVQDQGSTTEQHPLCDVFTKLILEKRYIRCIMTNTVLNLETFGYMITFKLNRKSLPSFRLNSPHVPFPNHPFSAVQLILTLCITVTQYIRKNLEHSAYLHLTSQKESWECHTRGLPSKKRRATSIPSETRPPRLSRRSRTSSTAPWAWGTATHAQVLNSRSIAATLFASHESSVSNECFGCASGNRRLCSTPCTNP